MTSWLNSRRPSIHYEIRTSSSRAFGFDSGLPTGIDLHAPPPEPAEEPVDFAPKFGFLDRLIPAWRRRREAEAESRRAEAMGRNAAALDQWQVDIAQFKRKEEELGRQLDAEIEAWRAGEREHQRAQLEAHNAIDELRTAYAEGRHDALEYQARVVLGSSQYADWIPREFELKYNAETRLILVDYLLPCKDAVPTLRGVTYVASQDDVRENRLKDAERDRLFDLVCYQIALRTMYELFEADEADALESVVFNGWVEAINDGTGILNRGCILSVQSAKSELQKFNLAAVDPDLPGDFRTS